MPNIPDLHKLDAEAAHRGRAPKSRAQNLARHRETVDAVPIRESSVEAYFCAQVTAAGGMQRKMEWVGRGGAPDRYASLPQCGPVFVELKRPGKDAETHQAREHGRMHRAGSRVLVLDTFEKVDQFIKEYTAMGDDAIIARLRTGESMFEKALLALITRLQTQPSADPDGTRYRWLFSGHSMQELEAARAADRQPEPWATPQMQVLEYIFLNYVAKEQVDGAIDAAMP